MLTWHKTTSSKTDKSRNNLHFMFLLGRSGGFFMLKISVFRHRSTTCR